MFENILNFFRKFGKNEGKETNCSKNKAKERLHLVLMQDRAHVSADFLELMKQEIIDVIKKYIVVDENSIDVRLTNKANDDGTTGAPSLYANIPIINIKNDLKAEKMKEFEGVNFNQKLEEVKKEEEKKEKEEETISEMIDGIEKEENKETDKKGDVEENKIEKSDVDSKNASEDDDDDDDDVTFDDLLKAAEEEDKKKVNEG